MFAKKLTLVEEEINNQITCSQIPKLYKTYIKNGIKYGEFEFIEGKTIYKSLLKTQTWPYSSIQEFNSKFLELIDLLISLARAYNFRHNDIYPKNIIIDKNNCIKLIDFGLSQTNTYNPKFPKYFLRRNHSVGQLKTFFFRKLPTDYSVEVFSLHNGLINELDITNLINLYAMILYLKYSSLVAWLDRIKCHIDYFNSDNNYPDKLEKLKYILLLNK